MEFYSKQPNMGIPSREEVLFVPLIDNLRKVSSDKSFPTGNYVSIQENLYDMISVTDDSLIESFDYDYDNHTIIIKYTNGVVKKIQLKDNRLLYVTYDSATKDVSFVMKYGEVIKLNIKGILDLFYTKTEIDNKDFIKWNNF